MPIRTYGLSGSGMDVDQMVKDLMKGQRARLDGLKQKKTQLEWKKTDYATMYSGIMDFRNNTVFNNTLQNNLMPRLVSSSAETVAKVTANADAANVNHDLTVTQLAAGVTKSSSGAVTASGASKSTVATQFPGVTGKFDIQINGKTITVDASQSINQLVSNINNAGAGVKAAYDTNLDRFFLYSSATGSTAGIDFSGSSTQGLTFLNQSLKLSTLPTIGQRALTSSSGMSVMNQFTGVPASFSFTMTNGMSTSTINVAAATDSLADVISKINNAKDANGKSLGIVASYDAVADKVVLKTKNVGDTVAFSTSDTGSFTGLNFLQDKLNVDISAGIDSTGKTSSSAVGLAANNKTLMAQYGVGTVLSLNLANGTSTATITVDTRTDTMATLLQKINNATDSSGNSLHANATYDAASGKFSLAATSGSLDISGTPTAGTNFLLNQLKLPPKTQGVDAQITLDGTSFTQSSNDFTIAGVKYSLKGLGKSSIGIAPDIDKMVDNVKTFVDAYNTTLKKINGEINEVKYKDYLPLTDDQKTAMKDADITAWETKAKSGMLRNDSILQVLADKMRSDISTPVSGLTGKYTSAASIGINTGMDWTEGGKLYVDDVKLKKALQEDPEAVYKIFGTATTGSTHMQKGLAVRLSESLNDAGKKIVDEAGILSTSTTETKSNIGKQLDTYTKDIKTMNTKLITLENSYYNKFNAMESALSKLNQQSSWLSSYNSGK